LGARLVLLDRFRFISGKRSSPIIGARSEKRQQLSLRYEPRSQMFGKLHSEQAAMSGPDRPAMDKVLLLNDEETTIELSFKCRAETPVFMSKYFKSPWRTAIS
jgi:hypothetical protein